MNWTALQHPAITCNVCFHPSPGVAAVAEVEEFAEEGAVATIAGRVRVLAELGRLPGDAGDARLSGTSAVN